MRVKLVLSTMAKAGTDGYLCLVTSSAGSVLQRRSQCGAKRPGGHHQGILDL